MPSRSASDDPKRAQPASHGAHAAGRQREARAVGPAHACVGQRTHRAAAGAPRTAAIDRERLSDDPPSVADERGRISAVGERVATARAQVVLADDGASPPRGPRSMPGEFHPPVVTVSNARLRQ
jgi:hypothetical protein